MSASAPTPAAAPPEVSAPSPVPTLRERRRERTREELVDALLGVIAEVGVDAVTVDLVVTRSGMARGTLYAHFPDGRDELLRAAYDRLGRELVERSREAVTAAHDWQERLVALARTMVELAGDRRVGYFYNVSGPVVVAAAPERGRGSGASLALVQEVLTSAQAAGEVGPELDAEATARLLVSSLRGIGIAVADGSLDPTRALAAFARLVAGLAAG